jgi:riboflavin kinase
MHSIINLEPKLLSILIALAKNGIRLEFVPLQDSKISELFQISRESFLEEIQNLIPKYVVIQEDTDKLNIKITTETEKCLHLLLIDLQTIFYGFPTQIKGLLASGLGEGQYYISVPEYSEQFQNLLGWIPYPGTLNIRLATSIDVEGFQRLINSPSHLIKGFKHEGRTFGEVLLWKCEIQHFTDETVEGAVIRPVRTHHNHQILELLAPENLRQRFNLKDEDTLTVIPNLT